MKHYLYNMFTGIKNGQIAKKRMVICEKKNVSENFLKVFWDEGYISGYKINDNNKIEIFLKYNRNGKPVINSLRTISKPSQRIYYSVKQLWKLSSNQGTIIFSTNKGLKTLSQCKKMRIGGVPYVIVK